jgi:hypothetical protein
MKGIGVYVALVFILLVIYLTVLQTRDYETIKEKGDFDTCTVEPIGDDVICYFNIHGEELSKRVSQPCIGVIAGEKFRVYYYKEIPDKYLIDFREPVIEESSFGRTVTLDLKEVEGIVHFSYQAEGKRFNRCQNIPDNVHVDLHSSYEVRYKINDPRIGYIAFKTN